MLTRHSSPAEVYAKGMARRKSQSGHSWKLSSNVPLKLSYRLSCTQDELFVRSAETTEWSTWQNTPWNPLPMDVPATSTMSPTLKISSSFSCCPGVYSSACLIYRHWDQSAAHTPCPIALISVFLSPLKTTLCSGCLLLISWSIEAEADDNMSLQADDLLLCWN